MSSSLYTDQRTCELWAACDHVVGLSGRNRSHRPPLLPTPPSLNTAVACQICNKLGHTARFCADRSNFAFVVDSLTDSFCGVSLQDSNNTWYLDSGASQHMTPSLSTLSEVQAYSGNHTVLVGDGQRLPISHRGHSILHTSSASFPLYNVLYVPSLAKNLLSIQKFA